MEVSRTSAAMVNGCRIYLVIRYPLQISISADILSSDPRIYTHFYPYIRISTYPSYPCIRHFRSAKIFRTPEYPCIRVSVISDPPKISGHQNIRVSAYPPYPSDSKNPNLLNIRVSFISVGIPYRPDALRSVYQLRSTTIVWHVHGNTVCHAWLLPRGRNSMLLDLEGCCSDLLDLKRHALKVQGLSRCTTRS